MEHLSLLADGQDHDPAAERARWEKAAADVLRKSGRMTADDPDALVWQKLTRTTLDGVAVAPLATPDTLEGLPPVGLPGQAPVTRGAAVTRPQEGWDIRAHLGDPDAKQAAADALLDLENGVTSLWLTVGRGGIAIADLPTVLDKVYLDLAPVIIDCPEDPVGAAEAFCALLDADGVTPAPGTSIAMDPWSSQYLSGHERRDEVLPRLVELARQHGCRITVDAAQINDGHGHDTHELGYSLAVGIAFLRAATDDLGLDVAEAASLLEFRYAVTDEQFLSIAKLRAARRLWARVLELSGAHGAGGQVQHAITSRAMLSKYDPWVNMLRGTVAAFAAGVGGAQSVTVLPFDSVLGVPDALGRRNARNTSALLVHEAHVARVTDPAGGSFAVEKLTDDLARAGWTQLQAIEADGGIEASIRREDGGLWDRIRDEGLRPRMKQVATRRRPLTGVSEFPNLGEQLPERRPHPDQAPIRFVDRYGHAFEELRDDPMTTPVFLATLGPVAQHTARATFASNLLAAGGVDTVVAGATSSVEDLVKAYRASEPQSPVVCLAGSDTSYAELGAEAVAELREAGASYVVLAGKTGDATVPEDVVDDSAAIGIDAIAFLRRVRQELAR